MGYKRDLKVLIKRGLVERYVNEWGEVCYRTTEKGRAEAET